MTTLPSRRMSDLNIEDVKLLERFLAGCQNESEEEELKRSLHWLMKNQIWYVSGRDIQITRYISLMALVPSAIFLVVADSIRRCLIYPRVIFIRKRKKSVTSMIQ